MCSRTLYERVDGESWKGNCDVYRMKFVYCSAFIVDLSKKLFRCFFSLFRWAACVRALFLYHICDCRGVFRPPKPRPFSTQFYEWTRTPLSQLKIMRMFNIPSRCWLNITCDGSRWCLSTARNSVYWEIVEHSHLCDAEWNMRQFRRNENEFDSNFPHTIQHISIHLSSFSVLHLVSSLIFRRILHENVFRESYYFLEIPSSSHNSQKSANIERRMEIHLIFQSAARSRLDGSLDKDCLLHFSRVLTPPRHFIVLCFSPSPRKAFKAREEDCWASRCRRRGKNHYWLIKARTHNVSQRRRTGRRAAKMKKKVLNFLFSIFQPTDARLSRCALNNVGDLTSRRNHLSSSRSRTQSHDVMMMMLGVEFLYTIHSFPRSSSIFAFHFSLFLSASFSSTQPWWGRRLAGISKNFVHRYK